MIKLIKKSWANPDRPIISSARALGVNVFLLEQIVKEQSLTEQSIQFQTGSNQLVVDQILAIDANRTSSFLRSIENAIKKLHGRERGNFSEPTGYPILGVEHLSPNYIEQVSKSTLYVGANFGILYSPYMARSDLFSNAVNTRTRAWMPSGPTYAHNAFIHFIAGLGAITSDSLFSFPVPDPYRLSASQASIVRGITGNSAKWSYVRSGETEVPLLGATLSALTISDLQHLKK